MAEPLPELTVGCIYPVGRYPDGSLLPFKPRHPKCWKECKGQRLNAKRYPELEANYERMGFEVTDGKIQLPEFDDGEGMFMLVRQLPLDGTE